MSIQGVLASRLTRVLLLLTLVSAITLTVNSWVVDYGKDKYQAGYNAAELKAANAQNAEVAKGLKDLNEGLHGLKTSIDNNLARNITATLEAEARYDKLITTLEALNNVPETQCTRINVVTLRLLNEPACEYNRKYGLGGGAANSQGCPAIKPTPVLPDAMRPDTGGKDRGY